MPINIGFTGTLAGMTHAQRFTVLDILRGLGPFYAHHGDCIGADEEFHGTTFLAQCLKRVIHPPLDNTKRAFCVPGPRRRRPAARRVPGAQPDNREFIDAHDRGTGAGHGAATQRYLVDGPASPPGTAATGASPAQR